MSVRFVSFLLLVSFFTEKTLTIFNIQDTYFVNYNRLSSAKVTNNFYKVTNNFSDSPRDFFDLSSKNGIKTVEIPRFTRVSPLLYYKDNKFSSEMQIR
jgi:hypothetical protein